MVVDGNGWTPADLESVGSCPVCAGTARDRLYEGVADRLHPEHPGSWSAWRCTACATGYVDPRPTVETVGRLYKRYYTHEAGSGDDPGLPPGIRGRALAAELNGRFGYQIAGALPLGRLLASARPGGRGMASQHVRDLRAPAPGSRLLDVGCSNGWFLRRMRSLGWEVEGFEPDRVAAALTASAGLDVVTEAADLDTMPDGRFDAITMCHVIEHAHNPVALLATCRRLLRPGGSLWVSTPNLDAAGARRYGNNWAPLDPPRHLVLFTPASLRRALSAAGFASVQRSPVTLQAGGWIHASSAALRDGMDEHAPPPLSGPDRTAARRADLAALFGASGAEEIALIATTGTLEGR